jgi:hypothetical protein
VERLERTYAYDNKLSPLELAREYITRERRNIDRVHLIKVVELRKILGQELRRLSDRVIHESRPRVLGNTNGKVRNRETVNRNLHGKA